MSIHPLLIAKLRALHSIFFEQWKLVPLYRHFPTYSSFTAPAMETPSTITADGEDNNYNDINDC